MADKKKNKKAALERALKLFNSGVGVLSGPDLAILQRKAASKVQGPNKDDFKDLGVLSGPDVEMLKSKLPKSK